MSVRPVVICHEIVLLLLHRQSIYEQSKNMTCDCRQYDYTRTVDCTAVIFNVTKNSLCDSTFAT